MKISDFKKPENHPFSMLRGYENAREKEETLTWMLIQCIKAGEFIPVKTKHRHQSMVSEGLLTETPEGYVLTRKAKGLLYAYFGKEADLV